MRTFAAVILLFFVPAPGLDAAVAVWIDTDASMGAPWREVDDAFALVLAGRSPELEIVGISTTYGNAPLPRTSEVTRALLHELGCRPPAGVHDGATSPAQFDRPTAATRQLAATLQQRGGITYIALGPLTNLASFLQQHPRLASRLERIVIVGGMRNDAPVALGPSGWPRIGDANVGKDPKAAALILEAGRPIELAPVEEASRVNLLHADWKRWNDPPVSSYIKARTGTWAWFWAGIVGRNGGPLFDVLPIAAVAQPRSVRRSAAWAHLRPGGPLVVEEKRRPGAVRVVVMSATARTNALLVERVIDSSRR